MQKRDCRRKRAQRKTDRTARSWAPRRPTTGADQVLARSLPADGVVAVSGRRPYLTDTRFYLHHGFQFVERTDTGFDLVCYKASDDAPLPRFSQSARRGTVSRIKGVHFEYIHQCPFVATCLRDLSAVAEEFALPVTRKELATVESAHNAASPFGTFGVFLYGKLITHELMSPRKFRDLLDKKLQSKS